MDEFPAENFVRDATATEENISGSQTHVFKIVDNAFHDAETGHRPIGVPWAQLNKTDTTHSRFRQRQVCRRSERKSAFYSAANRTFNHNHRLSLSDIRRAYVPKPVSEAFVKFSPEFSAKKTDLQTYPVLKTYNMRPFLHPIGYEP